MLSFKIIWDIRVFLKTPAKMAIISSTSFYTSRAGSLMEIQSWLMTVFAVTELSSCPYYSSFSFWRHQQSTLANFSMTWRITAWAWLLPYCPLFTVVLFFQSWRHLCGIKDSMVLVYSLHSRLWLVYALRLLGKFIREQMTDCWFVNIPIV